jgi:hypothetical protein
VQRDGRRLSHGTFFYRYARRQGDDVLSRRGDVLGKATIELNRYAMVGSRRLELRSFL